MFKWICLAVGAVILCAFGGTLLWMVNDIRKDAKPVLADLKRDMPTIVANTKKSTNTMAELSEDVKAVRAVLGLTAGKDKQLLVYTADLLDFIEKDGAGAMILADNGKTSLTGKLASQFLTGEKPVTVESWVHSARAKALWVAMFGSATKDDVLDKLSHNKFGVPYLIKIGDAEPIPLKDWVKSKHPLSAPSGE